MDSGLLLVSPYPQDARSLAQMLDDASLNVVHVRGLKDAASKLETGNFQVVVTEVNLEDGTWLDLLQLTRSLGTELVVTDPWAEPPILGRGDQPGYLRLARAAIPRNGSAAPDSQRYVPPAGREGLHRRFLTNPYHLNRTVADHPIKTRPYFSSSHRCSALSNSLDERLKTSTRWLH